MSTHPATDPQTTTPRSTATLNVTAWSPGEDVIEVQRSPAPGAARSDLAHLPRDRTRV